MVAIAAVSVLIIMLKRKTNTASFQNERYFKVLLTNMKVSNLFNQCSPAIDGALEVSNTTYDNPFQGANYSTMQKTLGEKEREEEYEGEKYDNPTYETIEAATGEYETAMDTSDLLESAKFEDEIYMDIN